MKTKYTIEIDIKKKYLKSPSVEQILSFVKEVGVNYTHFETYFGMPAGVIRNVKAGWKNLPVKFWPIFYERTLDKEKLPHIEQTLIKTALVPKKSPKKPLKTGDHGRLTHLTKK